MIQAYYAGRGWDEDGRVPRTQLDELCLAELVGEGEMIDD